MHSVWPHLSISQGCLHCSRLLARVSFSDGTGAIFNSQSHPFNTPSFSNPNPTPLSWLEQYHLAGSTINPLLPGYARLQRIRPLFIHPASILQLRRQHHSRPSHRRVSCSLRQRCLTSKPTADQTRRTSKLESSTAKWYATW